MATLKAHGKIIGRFETSTSRIAVMEDGKILQNCGEGWKLWRRLKPGVTPEQAVINRTERREKRRAACPNWARFTDLMIAEFSLKNRWKVHTAIDLMPNDPDGVWSTLEDYGMSCDLETLCELCELFRLAEPEVKAFNAANAARQ